MSSFEVKAVRVDNVEEHPNADRLTLLSIGGYKCISNKKEDGTWRYKAGDVVIYIPEQALLPEWLLKRMGFWNEAENKGTLAGKEGNRVKAIRLRGIVSQGVVYPVTLEFDEYFNVMVDGNEHTIQLGKDVAEVLGIEKWEPPVPLHMAGEVTNLSGKAIKYDIENIQKYPNVLTEGEEVVFTEKIHGTWTCVAVWPELNHSDLLDGDTFTASKGLSGQGLVFKNNERNDNNLYVRNLCKLHAAGTIAKLREMFPNQPVFMLGEIFGKVQDLQYGVKDTTFRVFDIWVGNHFDGRYLNVDELLDVANTLNLDTVPYLWRGPFTMEEATKWRDGKETVSGKGLHIREGIVIKPVVERQDLELGRVILKFVSPDYLLRKGDVTEFN
jgi:RNA ligase (TIGR02306 family)